MRSATIIFIITWCCFPCLGQDLLEYKVKALFENDKDEIAVDFFHGRMDAMQEVGIAIACQQKDCRAVLRYLRSKEELNYRGSKRKDRIVLEEVNTFGKITGKLDINIDNNELTGWWSTDQEKKLFALSLSKVEKLPSNATPCGKEKWIRYFSSNDSEAKMLIQNNNDQDLSGTLYLGKDAVGYRLEGARSKDGHYAFDIDKNGTHAGTLVGSFEDSGVQTMILNWTNGKITQEKFKSIDKLIYGCVEYGDFLGNYSMTYPLTRNESFNNWIESQVSSFVADGKNYGLEVRKSNPRLNPELRASIHANGWTEINYYDQKIISGIINFSKNWTSENLAAAFIFDLEKGKLINQEYIFTENSEFEALLSKRKELIKQSRQQDVVYCKWLDEQAFDLINIQYDGISFGSEFHPIFGREKIVFPFKEVSPYLVPDGALKGAIE